MSNTGWAPKPLRSTLNEGVFAFDETYAVVRKSVSAIEYQRAKDGTPITAHGPTALRAAGPDLVLRSDLVKSGASTAVSAPLDSEKLDPEAVVKAYLAHQD